MSEFSNKFREVLDVFRDKGGRGRLEKDSDIIIDLCDSGWKDGDWSDKENIVFFLHDNRQIAERMPAEVLENWLVDVLGDDRFLGEEEYRKFYDLLLWADDSSPRLINLVLVYLVGIKVAPSEIYVKFTTWMEKPRQPFKNRLSIGQGIENIVESLQDKLDLTKKNRSRIFVLVIRHYYNQGRFLDLASDDINDWKLLNKPSQIDLHTDDIIKDVRLLQKEVFRDFVNHGNTDAVNQLFAREYLDPADDLQDEDIWKCIRLLGTKESERKYQATMGILSRLTMDRIEINRYIPMDIIRWLLIHGLEFETELGLKEKHDLYKKCVLYVEKMQEGVSGIFFLAGQIPESVYEAASKNKHLFLLVLYDRVKGKNKNKYYLKQEDVNRLRETQESQNEEYRNWASEILHFAEENKWIKPEAVDEPKLPEVISLESKLASNLTGYEKLVLDYFSSHALEKIWPIIESIAELPQSSQFASFLYWLEETKRKIYIATTSEDSEQDVESGQKDGSLLLGIWRWLIRTDIKNNRSTNNRGLSAGVDTPQDRWIMFVRMLTDGSDYWKDRTIASYTRDLFKLEHKQYFLLSLGAFIARGASVDDLLEEDRQILHKTIMQEVENLLPPILVSQLSRYVRKTVEVRKREAQNISDILTPDVQKTINNLTPKKLRFGWGFGAAIGLISVFVLVWITGALGQVKADIDARRTAQVIDQNLPQSLTSVFTSTPLPSAPTSPISTPTPTLTPVLEAHLITDIQDWDTSTLLLYSRPKSSSADRYELTYLAATENGAETFGLLAGSTDFSLENCASLDWPFLHVALYGVEPNLTKELKINATCYQGSSENGTRESWSTWYGSLGFDETKKLTLIPGEQKDYLDSSSGRTYIGNRYRWSPNNLFAIQLEQLPEQGASTFIYLFQKGFYAIKNDAFAPVNNPVLETKDADEILAYDWIELAPDMQDGVDRNEFKGRLIVLVKKLDQTINFYEAWVSYGVDRKPEIYQTKLVVNGLSVFQDIYDVDVSPEGGKILIAGELLDARKIIQIYDLKGETDAVTLELALDQNYQFVDVGEFDEIRQVSWSPDLETKQIALVGRIVDSLKLPQSEKTNGLKCEQGCLFVVTTESLKNGNQTKWVWVTSIKSGIQHFWWSLWPE